MPLLVVPIAEGLAFLANLIGVAGFGYQVADWLFGTNYTGPSLNQVVGEFARWTGRSFQITWSAMQRDASFAFKSERRAHAVGNALAEAGQIQQDTWDTFIHHWEYENSQIRREINNRAPENLRAELQRIRGLSGGQAQELKSIAWQIQHQLAPARISWGTFHAYFNQYQRGPVNALVTWFQNTDNFSAWGWPALNRWIFSNPATSQETLQRTTLALGVMDTLPMVPDRAWNALLNLLTTEL